MCRLLVSKRGLPRRMIRVGSMTPIKPGSFQIRSREDRARRRCRTPAPLQGSSGIGIPSRKTQARHTGPLCSIRGKSEGGRSGGEPYSRVGQTSGQSKSRWALRVAETLHLFFSLVRLLIAVALKGDSLTCARAVPLRPAINADRLMKPIPHSVNLELAGLSIGPFTAHVAQTDTVDPLILGCELLFHVLRSGVPEIGARFLDLAARNAVAVPPKSIIVSAVIQRKPNTAVAATPKKSNNE